MSENKLIVNSNFNPSQNHVLCISSLLIALLLSVFSFLPTAAAIEGGVATTKTPQQNPLIGRWRWFNGDVNEFFPDGHAATIEWSRGIPSTGFWKEISRGQYEITWGGRFIDRLSISIDGTRLRGHNQAGVCVWGEKLRALGMRRLQ
jgi:hypothetical protein